MQRISLTAEPIWFYFTVKLLIGPGKVFNYFVKGYLYPLMKIDTFPLSKKNEASKGVAGSYK